MSSLAQTDALAKLLIEKGIITQQEFLAKILEERATYQAMLKPTLTLTQMNSNGRLLKLTPRQFNLRLKM